MSEKIETDVLPVSEQLTSHEDLVRHLIGAASLAEAQGPDLQDLPQAKQSQILKPRSEGSEHVSGIHERNLGGTGSPSGL